MRMSQTESSISRSTGLKALIPAAGLGTRFLPLTRVVPKEMLPIGNRPALELLVEEARRAGAQEIVVVISHAKELIREYFKDQPDVSFVYQEEQKGLGHAVLQAQDAMAGAERILVLLGDALVSGCEPGPSMAEISAAHGNASVIGCEHVPQEKVSRYGILKVKTSADLSAACEVEDLVEKPSVEEAPSDLAVAGRYLLSADIFRFLATQTPGKGGEIQLTDAIRRMIAEPGHALYAYTYPGKRHDIGNPQGYYETLLAFHEGRS